MVRREFPFSVLGKGLPHLIDLRVEIVGGRKNHRFDRHRLDRRAELLVAVMRHDEVLDLRAQHVGEVGYGRHRRANHHGAKRDVPDKIAVARVTA